MAKAEANKTTGQAKAGIEEYRDPRAVYRLLPVEALCIEVGHGLVPLLGQNTASGFVDDVVLLRKQFAEEMGLVLPAVVLRDNAALDAGQYVIYLRGNPVAGGVVYPDDLLALQPELLPKAVKGLDVEEPVFGVSQARWIAAKDRAAAEEAGSTVIDPAEVIATHLSKVVHQYADELLTRRELDTLLEELKQQIPDLDELMAQRELSRLDLQRVLRNLLREGVPVRDMELIIDTLCDNAPYVRQIDRMTDLVRVALRRSIMRRLQAEGELRVIMLDTAIEALLLAAAQEMPDGSRYVDLGGAEVESIAYAAGKQILAAQEQGGPFAIITSPAVRSQFERFISQFYTNITVICYNEVTEDVVLAPLGTITLQDMPGPQAAEE